MKLTIGYALIKRVARQIGGPKRQHAALVPQETAAHLAASTTRAKIESANLRPASADPAELASLLFSQLDNADSTAIFTAEALKEAMSDAFPAEMHAAVDAVLACVESFDFHSAMEQLQTTVIVKLKGSHINDVLIADRPDVLILDGQPEHLHLLSDVLISDFHVQRFSDDSKFMAYIEQGNPADLILLDIVMPNSEGYKVCSALREIRRLEHVPIIFLASLNGAEDQRKAFALGANDYISMPFSAPMLFARVKHHVELGRALRIIANQNDHLDQQVRDRTAALEQANAALKRELPASQTILGGRQNLTMSRWKYFASQRCNTISARWRSWMAPFVNLASSLLRNLKS